MKRHALQLICLAALAAPVFAEIPDPRPSTQPVVILCPSAEILQTQVMEVAPTCVANTVGLVSKNGDEGFGTGSGVVISADGLILTAGHVITKPGNPLTVRFADGRVFNGVAVGLDHATDTGIAKITDPAPAGGWPFSPIAPDDSAAIGDWVLTTGNPGSIVIGRNPPLRLGRVTGHDSNKIETNCAMEPGDSGGPLFDLKGRVVGTNSRIMTTSADVPVKEYLSLHVPVSLFTAEWKDLLAGENAHPDVQLGRKSTPRDGGRAAEQAQKFRQAMSKLLAHRDPEVIKLLKDSQKDGGQMPLTPELMQHLIDKADQISTTQPTTAPTALAKVPTTAPALAASPTTAPALANAPTTAPTRLASTPTTAPALAVAPTTAPAAVAVAPTTRPSQDALPKRIAKADPTTRPAAVSAEKGITGFMRPIIASQLKQQLLHEFPDAKITDAIINRILDRSSIDPTTHKLTIGTDEQDLRDMGITASAIAAKSMPSNRRAVEVGKTSMQTLALVAPSLEAAGDCVVEIRGNDNKSVLLGTIVDKAGYIVTKASDLPTRPTVLLADGRTVFARVIGKDTDTDLALLKISAHGLTAVRFADEAPLGEWVSALTADPNQPALGVVSDIARPIPAKFEHFAGEQKIFLGVGFAASSTILGQIMPGMPAEAAGLKVGDEVLELNGIAIADAAQFTKEIHKLKTGDTATIKVRRDGNEMEFKPVLGKLKATTQTMAGVGEADQFAGGKLSKRRTDFPMAIQTDAAIWADQCGGPLINLQGQAIGVTIARYDRVCTFAIPADVVQKVVAKLKGTTGT